MSVLDDVCFTVHASEGSDRTLMEVINFTSIHCFMISYYFFYQDYLLAAFVLCNSVVKVHFYAIIMQNFVIHVILYFCVKVLCWEISHQKTNISKTIIHRTCIFSLLHNAIKNSFHMDFKNK